MLAVEENIEQFSHQKGTAKLLMIIVLKAGVLTTAYVGVADIM